MLGGHLSFHAHLAEQLGAGKVGDVVRHGELAIGATVLGVHHPLGDTLAVEMGRLLVEEVVLQ